MIKKILTYYASLLDEYLRTDFPQPEGVAEVGFVGSSAEGRPNKLIVSLFGIERETAGGISPVCRSVQVAKTSLFIGDFHPFGNSSLRNVLQWVADDHWSPDNQNSNAGYPRLSRNTNENNTKTSDFWMRDGAFLKLKNAEIGYTFKNMRLYISGNNLLTFSKFDLWDPEQGGGSGLKYPTQRVFNIGFQMTFNNK